MRLQIFYLIFAVSQCEDYIGFPTNPLSLSLSVNEPEEWDNGLLVWSEANAKSGFSSVNEITSVNDIAFDFEFTHSERENDIVIKDDRFYGISAVSHRKGSFILRPKRQRFQMD